MTGRPPIGIVIPAHDEEDSIEACLTALLAQTQADDQIVVVCNGCSDRTAEVARGCSDAVMVEEIAPASKIAALNHGDRLLHTHPRLYLDGDVCLGEGTLVALAEALTTGTIELAAPPLVLDTTGSSTPVRMYTEIWSKLPSVRDDVVGRGAYALSRAGHDRLGQFPDLLGDDHYVRDLVPPHARRVVPCAGCTVRAPATLADVVRRRRRTIAGNRHIDRTTTTGRRRARRRAVQWLGVVGRSPDLLPLVPLYVGVAVWARVGVLAQRRSGRSTAWDGRPVAPREPAARPHDQTYRRAR